MEEYFNFWKICDEEKLQLASNKLDDEAKEWWEDIQIDRKRRGKHPICSWQRMKKILIDLWFPNDYYDILVYTSVDYKSTYSYEKPICLKHERSTTKPKLSQPSPCVE